MDMLDRVNIALVEVWEDEQEEETKQEKQKVEDGGIQKKNRVQSPPPVSISDFDLIPIINNGISKRSGQLSSWFPLMAWILKRRHFNPLLKFKGSKVDIKYALTFEFVGLSVWLLYIEVPPCIKEFATWALLTIYNATSEDNFVIHQTSVDYLVTTGLRSKKDEVRRQVNGALALLASSRRKGDNFAKNVTFGLGVLNCLLELVVNDDTFYEVFALSYLAKADKGMRDVIVNAELEKSYLPSLLKKKDPTNLRYVLETIACITRPNNPRWDDIESRLIPDICELMDTPNETEVFVAAVLVLNRALDKTTAEQIQNLVEMKILEGLCFHLELSDAKYLRLSFEGIQYILAAGDRENNNGNKFENKYAKYIDDYIGWNVLREPDHSKGCGNYLPYLFYKLREEYTGAN